MYVLIMRGNVGLVYLFDDIDTDVVDVCIGIFARWTAGQIGACLPSEACRVSGGYLELVDRSIERYLIITGIYRIFENRYFASVDFDAIAGTRVTFGLGVVTAQYAWNIVAFRGSVERY